MDPIRTARAAYNGRQPGDPSLAGQAILALLDAQDPPIHLLLGTDALNAVSATQKARTTEMDEWRFLSASTDRAADSGS
jgi:hypothetical protein